MTETEVGQSVEEVPRARDAHRRLPALVRALSFRNISALYVFVALFVLFSLWVPETFLTVSNWRTLLDSYAIQCLIAIGLVLPLAAGAFDLAIGAEVGFGAILVAWLLQTAGVPIVPAVMLTIAAGAVIGLVNALLVARMRIESFIATLGVSSILLAMVGFVSGNQQILGLSPSFQSISLTEVFGIPLPVYITLVVALGVWYVLDRTPVGRRIYATGGNSNAARLAGVRTGLVVGACLVACAVIATTASVLVTARIATGDPTIGPGYLLPAFSAAFLGSTQFGRGRFNVWGTVVAVYVIGTGVNGLQLAGSPVWIPDMFNGVALLLAVGLAKAETSSRAGAAIRRMLPNRRTRLRGAAE